jgi:hypothetical protein
MRKSVAGNPVHTVLGDQASHKIRAKISRWPVIRSIQNRYGATLYPGTTSQLAEKTTRPTRPTPPKPRSPHPTPNNEAQTQTRRRPGSPHSKKQTPPPTPASTRSCSEFTPKCCRAPFWKGAVSTAHADCFQTTRPTPKPSNGQVHPIARSKLPRPRQRQRDPVPSSPQSTAVHHFEKAQSQLHPCRFFRRLFSPAVNSPESDRLSAPAGCSSLRRSFSELQRRGTTIPFT